MATPHISAEPGDFADAVLLPGDPLRARHVAQHHLTGARQVTGVRNMLGFTGSYEGRPVSVMGTGMGIPSMSIYATELVTHFGCRRLVRVGSCGAIQPHVGLRDVVVAVGASTDSGVNRQRFGGWDLAAVADYGLLRAAMDAAAALGVTAHAGTVMSSDLFYPPGALGAPALDHYAPAVRLGVLAVEMEAAGLYGVAAEHGAAALAVCTVRDHFVSGEHLSVAERQTGFYEMVTVALRAVAGG
jgi:purine-nucleoside phosphorylase